MVETFTKESLIQSLRDIRAKGWIENARPGNAGGAGNTLEDLLGIEENNLPIPNAAEWELKCQKKGTTALTTLIHMEPSPRAIKFVPQILLPIYGWKHKEAGKKYGSNEMSFRQTIHAKYRSDRGFGVVVDRSQEKVMVTFDASSVDEKHSEWLQGVEKNIGLGELIPQPYWGFNDLLHKVGTKLHNCFYLRAETQKRKGITYFHYSEIYMLRMIHISGVLKALENGDLLVDFDARTGHNHGSKFRLRQNKLIELYEEVVAL